LNCSDNITTRQYAGLDYYDFVTTIPFMKKTSGQRRKDPRRAKSQLFQMRLSPAEKRAFSRAAELDGKTLSGWVSDRLRRLARQEITAAMLPDPFL
jgi:hypothetical protein